MDIRAFLIDAHAHAHFLEPAADWERPLLDSWWANTQPQQLREAREGHSSIAWILWHTARLEDMGINAAARGVTEVFDRDGWDKRIGTVLRHCGAGMTDSEAAKFAASVDVSALCEYRRAVGRETRVWLQTERLDSFDLPISDAGQRILASNDFIDPIAAWADGFFANRSAGWVFTRLGLWHNFAHLGQVEHVMHTLGITQS